MWRFLTRKTSVPSKSFGPTEKLDFSEFDWEGRGRDLVSESPNGGVIYSYSREPRVVLAWGSPAVETMAKQGVPDHVYLPHDTWSLYERSPEVVECLLSLWMRIIDPSTQLFRDPVRKEGHYLFSWERVLLSRGLFGCPGSHCKRCIVCLSHKPGCQLRERMTVRQGIMQ